MILIATSAEVSAHPSCLCSANSTTNTLADELPSRQFRASERAADEVVRLILMADSLIRIQLVESARPVVHRAQALADSTETQLAFNHQLLLAQVWAEVYEPMRGHAILQSLLNQTPASDKLRRCILHDRIARYINQTGQFSEAEILFRQNLAESQSVKNDSCIALAYGGLSMALGSMGRRAEQAKAALAMADFAKRQNLTEMEATGYNLAGYAFLQNHQPDEALLYLEKAAELYEDAGLPVRTLSAQMLIAWFFYTEGDRQQALKWYRQSLRLAIAANQKSSYCNILGCVGTILGETGHPDSAFAAYGRAIAVGKEARDYFNLSWIYFDQYKLYDTLGDYRQALASHILHKQFSDSLEAQQFRRGLNRIRESYAVEQQLKNQELLQLKLRQQKIISWSIVVGMALVSTVLVVIIMQIRAASRRRISEMKGRIADITQRNLRQQMNPHFIFNTLNSIQFYLYQQDKIAVNEYLNKFSLLIRKTLDNSRLHSIALKEEMEMVRLYLELEGLRFKERLTWRIEVDDEIDLIEMKVPAMLIQPLVENAITHGLRHKPEAGHVLVALALRDDHIECLVEDNGIGRDAARAINQSANPNHQSAATSITETRLALINELYGKELMVTYTDLTDDSGNPTGTRVVMTLPFNYAP
ncbi:MAG: histidine kinase [Bacteroidales bacterium]|nr:histidine kinase [Bacteroidales bacterium]